MSEIESERGEAKRDREKKSPDKNELNFITDDLIQKFLIKKLFSFFSSLPIFLLLPSSSSPSSLFSHFIFPQPPPLNILILCVSLEK